MASQGANPTATLIFMRAMRLGIGLLAIWGGGTTWAATAYWHAQGAAANWSDAGNWDNDNTKDAETYTPVNGDSLVWNANSTAYLSSTNDLVGLSVNAMTFTGAPGAVTIGGTNALTLGANYMAINAGGTAVTLDLPLVFGAGISYFVAQNTGLTINGVISQAAGNNSAVQVDGAGYELTLNGLNSFSGRSNINEGTLYINTLGLLGNPQSLGTGAQTSSIRLGYRTVDTDIGNLVYTGPATTSNWRIQLGDVNNYPNVGGGFYNNGSGAVTWTGTLVTQSAATQGTKFLTLGGYNADDNDWQAVITDVSTAAPVSLTKAGTGKWILSGNNIYTGNTTVTEGTLVINGNQSAATGLVTVAGGATLGGTGTLGGVATISGSLAPGNSIGTLTIANDVTWNAGNAWVFELGAAGAALAAPGTSDLLNITGAGSDFLKGTGSGWTFDFAGTGADGWYKLVDWGGTTSFAVGDFTASNLTAGATGSFTIDGATSALYLQVIIPEPTSLALLGLAGLALLKRPRKP